MKHYKEYVVDAVYRQTHWSTNEERAEEQADLNVKLYVQGRHGRFGSPAGTIHHFNNAVIARFLDKRRENDPKA